MFLQFGQATLHFFLPLPITFLTSALIWPERFFLASMSLKRSKSVRAALAFLAAIFFPHCVCPNLPKVSSADKAFLRVFSLAPRKMFGVTLSVRVKRLTGICCLLTPVLG